jgi:hypothetical protein
VAFRALDFLGQTPVPRKELHPYPPPHQDLCPTFPIPLVASAHGDSVLSYCVQ